MLLHSIGCCFTARQILRVADVGQNLKSLWNSLSTDERQAQLLFIHNAVNSMGSFFGKSTEVFFFCLDALANFFFLRHALLNPSFPLRFSCSSDFG